MTMTVLMPWLYGWCGALAGIAALHQVLAGHWDVAISLHLIGIAGIAAVSQRWVVAPGAPVARSRRITDGNQSATGVMVKRRKGANEVFAIVMAAVVPVLGPMLAWVHLVGARTVKRGTLMEDYAEHLDSTAHAGQQQQATALTAGPAPDQLASLADVIGSEASDDFKRSAIENLARMETPQAVEVLRKTLAHPSVEVRFYAAGALDHLERRLATRVESLERQLAIAGGADPVVLMALAQACFDHSYYRVATDRRRAAQLDKALSYARRALDAGGDVQAWVLAGRALLELGRHAEAELSFQHFLTIRADDVKGLLWYAEAQFRLGKFQAVRATCAKARRAGAVPSRMEAAVWMWA